MQADPIPDAVAAVVRSVLEGRSDCDPVRCGRLIVQELRALGWRIEAPLGIAAPRRAPPPPEVTEESIF